MNICLDHIKNKIYLNAFKIEKNTIVQTTVPIIRDK